ncbi:MAG: M20/M25/M40 family metallo-hydrolase [Bacteroidetes bacterium]|nr:M20/M25/M40 family metallo-hydrolase [Bacteroidota bacterium]
MKKFFLVFLISPVLSYCQPMYQQGVSDSAFFKMISDNVLKSKAADKNLFELTKDIGGRLAGSPQMLLAEKWGEGVLKKAGADKVILQECKVPHWVRGTGDMASVTYQINGKIMTDKLSMVAIGNSVGTGPSGITAPLIKVNSFEELEQRKDEVKGKIVFYNCPFQDEFIQTFMAYGMNVRYRTQGASRAAKYGALAVIVRSMTNSTDNNAHTGTLAYTEGLPKIPAACIGLWDVAKLDSLFAKGISIQAKLVTHAMMLPDATGHNVIGILTGTEFPNEVITVGGHLDSWDVNEGAQDDGAGVVQTIEILRAFKALGYQPKHTIQFVLFANEENGSRGAEKYASEALRENEKHLFALESDAGGFTPRGFGFTVSQQAWDKINSWKHLFEPYGADHFSRYGGGEDIEPLGDKYGTPLSSLSPDSQRYFDLHHAAGDVFENVNMRELKLGAINMAGLIYLVDKYGL